MFKKIFAPAVVAALSMACAVAFAASAGNEARDQASPVKMQVGEETARYTGVIRGWEWSRWTPLAACSRVTLPRMMLRDLQLLPAIPRPAHVDAPRRGGATPVASREGGKGALLRSKLNAWTYRHSCDASQGLMMIMLDIATM